DILFTIDSREAKAKLASAKTRQERAVIALQDARSQFRFYEAGAKIGAKSKEELDHKRFQIKLAEADLKQEQTNIHEIETILDTLKIKAPLDGNILKVNARVGEYAPAGLLANPLI